MRFAIRLSVYALALAAPISPAFASESITYTYDTLGRLTAVTNSGAVNSGVTASYNYDPAGNRNSQSVTGVKHLVVVPNGSGYAVIRIPH